MTTDSFNVRGGRVIAIGLAVVAGCFEPPVLPVPVEAVAILPEGLVVPDSPVVVVFSGPVHPAGPADSTEPEALIADVLAVRDRDGAPVAFDGVNEGARWRLRPRPSWPGGEVLRVMPLGPDSVLDDGGAPVEWPDEGLVFEVAPVGPVRRTAIRWPTPGVPVAAGVQWIAVEDAAEGAASAWLRREDDALEAVRRETIGAVTRFALRAGPCGGLCPGAMYRLDLPGGEVVAGVRAQVETSTQVDLRAPSFTFAEVDVRPGEVEVRWAADEPVRVTARWTGPQLAVEAVVGLGRAGVWRSNEPLEPGVTYDLTLSATDLFERTGATIERRLIGPAPVQVALSELVPTPRSDWSDSEPRGEPFDESPGQGTVSSTDEWVELINISESSIDLEAAGLRLLTLDGTPAETVVAAAPALRFGDGGSPGAWRPGEALVVRPRGDMTQTSLTVEVWAGVLLLDQVVLGDGPEADHPGGSPPDLVREALARSPAGRWRWCRPTPGDPRPNSACEP